MTVTRELKDGTVVEYAGVIARAGQSPMYRLVAPDSKTVETYAAKPSADQAKQDLLDAGYDVPEGSKVPYRDLQIGAERLPGNLSL